MLHLDNAAQAKLLTISECIDVLEGAFRSIDSGQAIYRPKTDVHAPNSKSNEYYRFGSMEGWYDGVFAIRFMSDVMSWEYRDDGSWREDHYCIKPGQRCAVVMLFSSETGAPLALLNDAWIQRTRVGASGALGTKLLSRENAETLCILGSGGIARPLLEGICAIRPIRHVRIFSPSQSNRDAFASTMSEQLGLSIEAADNAQAAMAGADIVATCTNSGAPVFEADWLEPGMHVVSVGTNEVSPEAVQRFDVSVRQGVSSMAPAKDSVRHRAGVGLSYAGFVAGSEEQMARIPEGGSARIDTSNFPMFTDVVAGRAAGRSNDDEITFYYCHGNQGLQFAAVGGAIYRNAIKAKSGAKLPLDLFIQDDTS